MVEGEVLVVFKDFVVCVVIVDLVCEVVVVDFVVCDVCVVVKDEFVGCIVDVVEMIVFCVIFGDVCWIIGYLIKLNFIVMWWFYFNGCIIIYFVWIGVDSVLIFGEFLFELFLKIWNGWVF